MKIRFWEKIVGIALFFCCSALVGCVLTSCSEDEDDDYIWDFYPVEIYFEIVNQAGEDLLAPGGELYGTDISVLLKGKDYPAEWNPTGETRVYMPIIRGLLYQPAKDGGKAKLYFGELDGGHLNETLYLNMPNGESHRIYISRKIRTKGPDTSVKQIVKVDGKVIDYLTDGSCIMNLTIVYDK